MRQTILLSLLAGIAVAAGTSCTRRPLVGGAGDVETRIVLRASPDNPQTCIMTSKESYIRAFADKWLEFEVRNHCGSAQEIVVGNFRTSQTSSATDCQAAMAGGAAPIFQQDDLSRRTANPPAGSASQPGEDEIRLKIKKSDELPAGTLDYYFDVCLNGAKVDPRLIIER